MPTINSTFGRVFAPPSLVVFAAFFSTAKLGQFILNTGHTSPALIWAPAGIALGAVLLYGYEVWPAIALASLLASATNGAALPGIIGATVGNTIQPLLGAYALRSFEFDPALRRTRDAVILLGAAFFVSTLSPAISLVPQALTHTLSVSAYLIWTRGWAGQMLSILVVTPLITTWLSDRTTTTRAQKFEAVFACTALVGITYFLFWTYSPPVMSWLLLAFLMPLLWLALRMGPRSMSVALFLATTLAVAGTIIAHPNPAAAISQQLLSDEIVMEFIAAIFFIIVCAVEERRTSDKAVQGYVEQLQTALQKSNTEDKAKTEFLAILAHELRNPLAPVLSTLELLKLRNSLSGDDARMLESAEERVHTMSRLLDDLLDLSRISQKKFRLQKEPVRLSAMIASSTDSVSVFAHTRGQMLTISLPHDEVWLDVDPVRFEQIVVNLLSNAVKYTESGGTISLQCETEGNNFSLQVADSGIGIEQKHLQHIFEPFQRVSEKRTRQSGLGIGLSLTKRLVEMHDGNVVAHSEGLGKGSQFVVELPACVVQMEQLPLESRERVRADHPQKTLRILVVDDNQPAAQGLGKLLAHKGHTVTLAYDGAGALEAVTQFEPEIIVLDIGLPDMDGYEVARELRRQGMAPSTILIALTGYGQQEDKLKAQKAGFDHHLTKPVGIKEVESLLVNFPTQTA